MKFLQSFDPASNELVWEGPETDTDRLKTLLNRAKNETHTWAHLSLEERFRILKKFEERVLYHQEALAMLISRETGKPLWESKSEVASLIQKVEISYSAYLERCPNLKTTAGKHELQISYRPHGVVAVFGPFNFPMHLPNGHLFPALLAGNCVLFKPSEKTPASGEALYRCYMEAGVPEGVLQIAQGGREIGQAITDSEEIQGLFFTGSAETGKLLAQHFGSKPEKILALELGGNNPLVISTYADITACAYLIIQSAFLTSGQRCTAARRLVLIRSPQNEVLLAHLLEMVKKIKIGAWNLKPEPFMGPLIDSESAKKVLNAYKEIVKQGANELYPMQAIGENTSFLTPGIVDVTSIAQKNDQEVFGPLLQVIWVQDLEEAIEEANRTRFGLSAGIVTLDPYEWGQFRKKIRAGIVNWNTPLTGASSKAPFGGRGLSGNHRPSAYLAADYCSDPVSSLCTSTVELPINLHPGIELS